MYRHVYTCIDMYRQQLLDMHNIHTCCRYKREVRFVLLYKQLRRCLLLQQKAHNYNHYNNTQTRNSLSMHITLAQFIAGFTMICVAATRSPFNDGDGQRKPRFKQTHTSKHDHRKLISYQTYHRRGYFLYYFGLAVADDV